MGVCQKSGRWGEGEVISHKTVRESGGRGVEQGPCGYSKFYGRKEGNIKETPKGKAKNDSGRAWSRKNKEGREEGMQKEEPARHFQIGGTNIRGEGSDDSGGKGGLGWEIEKERIRLVFGPSSSRGNRRATCG